MRREHCGLFTLYFHLVPLQSTKDWVSKSFFYLLLLTKLNAFSILQFWFYFSASKKRIVERIALFFRSCAPHIGIFKHFEPWRNLGHLGCDIMWDPRPLPRQDTPFWMWHHGQVSTINGAYTSNTICRQK